MIGKQILNYKIIAEIGKGGMATVYKAKHVNLNTTVAIKILNPALAAEESIKQRFKQEAQIMATLKHPGITQVYDFVETDNHLAIIMEYLQGETLNDLIKRSGTLGAGRTNQIFNKILDAFSYAHSKNIIHRDIKPSNIFITRNGDIKIMDFGIAKIIEDGSNALTQTGTQMGTPVYMSPEQINDSKNIDHLSDIYSLGVVLWFMLAGKPPYDDKTYSRFAIFKKIDTEPLPQLGMPFYDPIIQKATQKDKYRRFSSCYEFAKAMRSEEGTRLAPPPPPPPPQGDGGKTPGGRSSGPRRNSPVNRENLTGFGYYLKAFKNYANFSGRASRKEFWYFFLFHILFIFLFAIIDALLIESGASEAPVLMFLYLFASFIPYLAVATRRLHDIDKSAWYLLLYLVPYIGGIILLILYAQPGHEGPNEYGDKPNN